MIDMSGWPWPEQPQAKFLFICPNCREWSDYIGPEIYKCPECGRGHESQDQQPHFEWDE